MFISNKKIRLPLLAAFLGAAIGALSREFAWTLLASLSALALVCTVQNLFCLFHAIKSSKRGIVEQPGDALIGWCSKADNWLRRWDDDITHCPSYKGTPGNIWNGPNWVHRR